MRLSVVMPNYNHARYLPASLGELLRQTGPEDEVLVVDDASTDDSVAVIERMRAGAPRLRLLRNERNRGAIESLRRGIAECSGEFLYCPAADDNVAPGFVERTLSLLARHPEAGLCCCLVSLLGEDGGDAGPYRTPLVSPVERYFTPAEAVALFLRHGSWVAPQGMLFRREAVLELGGYRAELAHGIDGFLFHGIATRRGVCFIPERLAYWRPSENSLAMQGSENTGAALDLIWRIAGALRELETMPEAYLRRWERLAVLKLLDDLTRRKPYPREAAAQCAARLRDPVLAAATRSFVATKLYLFLRFPLPDQLRIAARKLGFRE